MSADDIKYIIVQCLSEGQGNGHPGEMSTRVDDWHFYVRRDGTMIQNRMLLEAGRHSVRYNRHSIGICYEGAAEVPGRRGSPSDPMSVRQKSRVTDLVTILQRLFPDARII